MKQPVGGINCLWGTAYLDGDGVWKCPTYNPNDVVQTTKPIKLPPFSNTVLVPVSTPTVAGATQPQNTILAWIKAHPYITATALLTILYVVFFKGRLGASSKVRTDITRWGL